jgi:hypothetical protein
MASYRISMIFEGTTVPNTGRPGRSFGWSESLWLQNDITFGDGNLLELCRARAVLLARGIAIVGVRKEVFDPKGLSTTATLLFPGTNGLQTGTVMDFPSLALYFRLPSSNPAGKARSFVLRGLPDEAVKGGEWFPGQIAAGLQRQETVFRDYVSTIVGGNWKGRYTTPDTIYPVGSIDGDPKVVYFIGPNTLQVGDWVRAYRMIGNFGQPITGRWRIATKPTSDTATLTGWNQAVSVGTEGNPSFRSKQTVLGTFLDPGASLVPKVVSRKVGRPFDLFRGKASKRN